MLSRALCNGWAAAAALQCAGTIHTAGALLGSRRLSGTAAAAATAAAAVDRPELGPLPLAFPAVCIWGSNTGVGKTLFSAGLAAACRRAGLDTLYLKPVQTGFPTDSDARLVAAAAGLPLVVGPHAAELDPSASQLAAAAAGSDSGSLATTLYAWGQPVSPHLAVETEGRGVSDGQVAAAVAAELRAFAAAGGSGLPRIALVETAGGCDLLRALRLPGVLVGDGRLGGISATLSAYDSLALRGHSVPLVVLMDDGRLANSAALRRQLRGKAEVLAFPVCQPPPEAGPGEAAPGLIDASLAEWLEATRPQFDRLLQLAGRHHQERLRRLQAAAGDARRMLWWPFTQHSSVAGDGGVTVIDARVGEAFSVYRPAPSAARPLAAAGAAAAAAAASVVPEAAVNSSGGGGSSSGSSGGSLELLYDACASWWTQGVSEAAQPELVRAVSAAAARYGHVMFPENAHEPALELARQMLDTVGRGWADRVFYTDNGSCAIEVALKMAFRKHQADHGLLERGDVELQVLGLEEGYHGDTLGAMDAVAPSPFNGRLQTPWYSGRGLFLDPPTVALQQGAWRVALPADMRAAAAEAATAAAEVLPGSQPKPFATEFASQEAVFALPQRMPGGGSGGGGAGSGGGASLYPFYRSHIGQQLDGYAAASAGRRQLGACILEPVLQGAGGMRLIDPLYQRALVDVCRERRIPVIFDEVFTGFWRLGATSGARLLGAAPDIACYAKLLTGGLLPLSATLAREEVFAAFEGDSKARALLHGHSYTAHPVGCSAGVAALQLYRDASLNPNWCTPAEPGCCRRQQQQEQQQSGGAADGAAGSPSEPCCGGPCGRLLPLWDADGAAALSRHPGVHSVVPLGTVLAVRLRAPDGSSGYGSNAAAAVVKRLRQEGVFARPLGDVVYLMVTPMTQRQQCDVLLAKLAAALS